MILGLQQLTDHLKSIADPEDTSPSQALWITLAPEGERHAQSIDYKTPDENTLVRIYLDRDGAIVGIEVFP